MYTPGVAILAIVFSLAVPMVEPTPLEQLEAMDMSLHEAERQLDEVRVQSEKLGERVRITEIALHEAEERLEKLSDELKARSEAILRMKRHEIRFSLKGTLSPWEQARRNKFIKLIIESDARMLADYSKQMEETRQLHDIMESHRQYLVELERSLEEQRLRTKEIRALRVSLLSRIRQEANLAKETSRELSAAQEKLVTMVNNLDSFGGEGFPSLKGFLARPVPGSIELSFGPYTDPLTSTEITHDGLDLQADLGEPVKAVASGTVVFSGWFRGYGQLMIVDHGDGFHTLSAHLSQLLKEVGEPVNQGEEIGLVGDSGSLKGPYLYFELRHSGRSVDPIQWFEP